VGVRLEPVLGEFAVMEDLRSLTEEQRQQIRIEHARHNSTASQLGFEDAMTNPTPVYEPGSPLYEEALRKTMAHQQALRNRGTKQKSPTVGRNIHFDSQQGFVVEGEDFNVLVASGMQPEQALKICSTPRPKPASKAKVKLAEMAALGPAQRDAEIRFGKL
jgi:hypothetical protein